MGVQDRRKSEKRGAAWAVSSHSSEREMHDGTGGDIGDIEIEAMIRLAMFGIRKEAQASQKTQWRP
jgi:hypothetical protein